MSDQGDIADALCVIAYNERPTMRDRFAMAALAGLMSGEAYGYSRSDVAAQRAYEIADAMMAEGEKR